MRGPLKSLFTVLLIIIFISPIISGTLFPGQDEPLPPKEPTDPAEPTDPGKLNFKETVWARIGAGGRMVTVSDPLYRRGEDVYLLFREVGTFKRGMDGKHKMDLDMKVTGPTGNIVLDQTDLLGEGGHSVLRNGVASSPHGIFQSHVGLQPGPYRMTLTIRDEISGARATVTKTFRLSGQLGYRKAVFARKGANGKLEPVDDAVFQRGETVQLVVLNAGQFKMGADGKHRFEIDLEVKGPSGTVTFRQQNMLKEAGHKVLEKNIATSPYALYYSSVEMAAGAYKMKITIRDVVAGQALHVTRPFTLK
ncbi:MAG: hypothetical protein GY940_29505 [bacterium]|nr:hypothetical protein [bacterium]